MNNITPTKTGTKMGRIRVQINLVTTCSETGNDQKL